MCDGIRSSLSRIMSRIGTGGSAYFRSCILLCFNFLPYFVIFFYHMSRFVGLRNSELYKSDRFRMEWGGGGVRVHFWIRGPRSSANSFINYCCDLLSS